MPQPEPGKTRLKRSEVIVPEQLPPVLLATIVLRRITDPAARRIPPLACALLLATVTLLRVTVAAAPTRRPPPSPAGAVLPLSVTLVRVVVAAAAEMTRPPPPPAAVVAVFRLDRAVRDRGRACTEMPPPVRAELAVTATWSRARVPSLRMAPPPPPSAGRPCRTVTPDSVSLPPGLTSNTRSTALLALDACACMVVVAAPLPDDRDARPVMSRSPLSAVLSAPARVSV